MQARSQVPASSTLQLITLQWLLLKSAHSFPQVQCCFHCLIREPWHGDTCRKLSEHQSSRGFRGTRTPEPWATVLTVSHYAQQIYVTPENLDLLVQTWAHLTKRQQYSALKLTCEKKLLVGLKAITVDSWHLLSLQQPYSVSKLNTKPTQNTSLVHSPNSSPKW